MPTLIFIFLGSRFITNIYIYSLVRWKKQRLNDGTNESNESGVQPVSREQRKSSHKNRLFRLKIFRVQHHHNHEIIRKWWDEPQRFSTRWFCCWFGCFESRHYLFHVITACLSLIWTSWFFLNFITQTSTKTYHVNSIEPVWLSYFEFWCFALSKLDAET